MVDYKKKYRALQKVCEQFLIKKINVTEFVEEYYNIIDNKK